MHRVAKVLLVAAMLGAASAPAPAYVEISGVFIADGKCQAFDSIRRETNPGGILTIPGQSYGVRGLNREDGDFVHVEVPGATPATRWVNRACGDLFREEVQPPGGDEPGAAALMPFFDADDRPNDPTPRPPALGAFDQAVLRLCGEWGSRPRPVAFRALLDEPAHAADIERIYQALDQSVLGPRREPGQFKNELTAVWFNEEGFRHVFCGEPTESTIGGLHFAGRYLQMQEQGWGGLEARCGSTETVPPVYTFGVRYRTPRERLRTACPKGYALNLDAGEILIEATKALKAMLPRTSGKAMCLHKVEEQNQRAFLAVFVIKSGAVRTFYPDASPSCERDRPPANCLCAP